VSFKLFSNIIKHSFYSYKEIVLLISLLFFNIGVSESLMGEKIVSLNLVDYFNKRKHRMLRFKIAKS